MDLSEPLALVETLSSRLDDKVDELSNAIEVVSNNFGELDEGFGALEAWRTATNPKIRTYPPRVRLGFL